MSEYKKTLNQAKHEAMLEEWRERIRECRNSGLRICEWCKKNGVNRKTYYRWQREIWEMECKKTGIEAVKQAEIQFSEIPNIYLEPEKKAACISVQKNGWTIEIQNHANPELVSIIIGTVARYV